MLRAGVLTSVCGLAMLAGCADGAGPEPVADRAVQVSQVLGAEPGSTAVGLSADDRLFIEQTVDVLTQRCVAEAGLDWPLPERSAMEETRFPAPDDLDAAGYPINEQKKRDLADRSAVPEGSPELSEALFGPDDAPNLVMQLPDGSQMGAHTSGCSASAIKQVYGSVEREFVVTTMRSFLWGLDAENAIIARQPYQDVLASWRTCMQGTDAADTGQAVSGMQMAENLYRSEDIAAADRQTAVLARADARCMRESGLYEVHERLAEEHRTKLTSSYGFSEAALIAAERQAFDRARELAG